MSSFSANFEKEESHSDAICGASRSSGTSGLPNFDKVGKHASGVLGVVVSLTGIVSEWGFDGEEI